MGSNKTGGYPFTTQYDKGAKIMPSVIEFPTISLSGEAPPHVQARVLDEYKANQEQIKRLRGDHA